MNELQHRIRNFLRFRIGASWPLYAVWQTINGRSDYLVDRSTSITVEGYPRSANTYVVAAISAYSDDPLRIARHTHAISQVRKSVQLDIPTVLLIRHPEECIASRLIRERTLTPQQALRDYILFYQALYPLRSRLVLTRFSMVTENVRRLLEKLSQRWGLSLSIPSGSEDVDQRLFQLIDKADKDDQNSRTTNHRTVARPKPNRNHEKKQMRDELRKSHQCLLNNAINLYHIWVTR